MATLSFSKICMLSQCEQQTFFPEGVSLITWYVSVWPCSRPGIFCFCLWVFTLLSDDPLHFPCLGWNTWFYDCISNMLLLRAEFDTDPSPTLSPFSCAVMRNLVTSENLGFMLQSKYGRSLCIWINLSQKNIYLQNASQKLFPI